MTTITDPMMIEALKEGKAPDAFYEKTTERRAEKLNRMIGSRYQMDNQQGFGKWLNGNEPDGFNVKVDFQCTNKQFNCSCYRCKQEKAELKIIRGNS